VIYSNFTQGRPQIDESKTKFQTHSSVFGHWGGLAVAAYSPIDCIHFNKNQHQCDIFDHSANHMLLSTSRHMKFPRSHITRGAAIADQLHPCFSFNAYKKL